MADIIEEEFKLGMNYSVINVMEHRQRGLNKEVIILS